MDRALKIFSDSAGLYPMVRRLARASLSLATVVASGGDLVHASARLHAWDGAAWRGAPLCEVVLSLGMQAALP